MPYVRIEVQAGNSCSQFVFERKFRSAMKAFIYHKLENSSFALDKTTSSLRHFCFSSPFPVRKACINEGEVYSLTISSASPELIYHLMTNLDIEEEMNLGEAQFVITEAYLGKEEVHPNSVLESIHTIVVRRVGEGKLFVNYEEEKEEFLRILSRNLVKKYNDLMQKNVDEALDVFAGVEVEPVKDRKKGSSHHALVVDDVETGRIHIYGNRLRFKLEEVTPIQREILQVGVEDGFGSMNSYGCGFMREVK